MKDTKMTNIKQVVKKMEKCRMTDSELVIRAFKFAQKAHGDQKRLGGGPYIEHPLWVASFLADLCLDEKTIAAALLHDVLEDTEVTKEEMEKEFGKEITAIVWGVSKLRGMKEYGQARDIENLRKMFLAMAADVRVVLIRLADRLHNLQTLNIFSPEKRKRIAKQTIEIYAPLAERLGIGEMKGELEDLSFAYLYPKDFRWVKALAKTKIDNQEKYIKKVIKFLNNKLAEEKINAEIHGRAKHLWSLYKKLLKNNKDISKIYDLVAVRIIVSSVEDCYKVLGIIHQMWKPLPGKIKDYIAMPKPNGYKSLHTTVFCLDGKIIEIQIKTQKMHEEAEWGVAAHWHYAESGKKSKIVPEEKLSWVKQLVDWQTELKTREEFTESLKIDIFEKRIFVFTPKGDVFDLPEGATPIDFAYHIHSEVGDKCSGAIVNGKIIPLDSELQNGDVVDVNTSKKSVGPKRDWLNFVKTNVAKNHIRSFFKKKNREENIEAGTELLEEELKRTGKERIEKIDSKRIEKILDELHFKNLEDLIVAVGEGTITTNQVIRKLFSEEHLVETSKVSTKATLMSRVFGGRPDIRVDGSSGFMIKLAACCHPIVGEPISGFVTRGKGVTVHKKDCPALKGLDKRRLVQVDWGERSELFRIPIKIKAIDRVGLFRDIGQVASSLGINLVNIASKEVGEEMEFSAILEITKIDQVIVFFRKIKEVDGVVSTERQ